MENTLTITILAKDVLETFYTVTKDCAITRALHRAGKTNWYDFGLSIREKISNLDKPTTINADFKTISIENESYDEMSNYVVDMYKKKRENEKLGTTHVIEDKTFTLILN